MNKRLLKSIVQDDQNRVHQVASVTDAGQETPDVTRKHPFHQTWRGHAPPHEAVSPSLRYLGPFIQTMEPPSLPATPPPLSPPDGEGFSPSLLLYPHQLEHHPAQKQIYKSTLCNLVKKKKKQDGFPPSRVQIKVIQDITRQQNKTVGGKLSHQRA